jgi:hypothetical protein
VLSFVNGKPKDLGSHIVNSGVYFFKGSDLKSVNRFLVENEIANSIVPELVSNRLLDCQVIEEERISVDSVEALTAARLSGEKEMKES